MKIVIDYPPNIELIRATFKLHDGIVFCYGDTLFNPDNGPVDDALMAHEETHMRQQEEMGVERWWNYYLSSALFRVSQEVEAYQNQYKVFKKLLKDKNDLNRALHRIASDLSSEMYGKVMTLVEARKAIQEERPIRFDLSKLE